VFGVIPTTVGIVGYGLLPLVSTTVDGPPVMFVPPVTVRCMHFISVPEASKQVMAVVLDSGVVEIESVLPKWIVQTLPTFESDVPSEPTRTIIHFPCMLSLSSA